MKYSICFLLSLAVWLGAIAQAQEHSSDVLWHITPSAKGLPSEAEKAARESVLPQIEKLQSDEFRRTIKLDVPNQASGLPQNYNIHVYGTYSNDAQWIKVEVRGEKAKAEFATNGRIGFRHGSLPSNKVNQLTREFLYASRTKVSFRSGEHNTAREQMRRALFATHTIFFRIEVDSQDPNQPLRLMTDARQPIEGTITNFEEGINAFAHSRYCRSLQQLLNSHLTLASSSDLTAEEIVQRLTSLASRGKRSGEMLPTASVLSMPGSEIIPHRMLDLAGAEKAFVEAQILGKAAVDMRVRDAAPILEQLGLKKLANQVRMATAQD